jgi:hypothetical protein
MTFILRIDKNRVRLEFLLVIYNIFISSDYS